LIQVSHELKHNLIALLAHDVTGTLPLEHPLVFILALQVDTGIAAHRYMIQIIILSLMIARYLKVRGAVRLVPDCAPESL
jgi:hypothetical protein